jgi:N-methylhydantoinase A
VNLRVSGIGPIRRPDIKRVGSSAPGSPIASREADDPVRQVCFDAAEGYVDTRLYQRSTLEPGVRIDGPAIIEEFGSTVPLHPGFTARIDEYLNIIVTRSQA